MSGPTFTIDGRNATEAEARASWRARAMHSYGYLAREAMLAFDFAKASSDPDARRKMLDVGILMGGI